MTVRKRVLEPDRIRRLPKGGWSWIDRGFVREHVDALSRDAVLLYFFLVAVSDKQGLSYYGDAGIISRLKLTDAALERARDELETRDLVAYRPPFYQVLSLPCMRPPEPTALRSLGDILERAARSREVDPADGATQ
jgi:hypothetical protein